MDRAFAKAARVIEKTVTVPRILACAMEPRAIHVSFSRRDNRFHLVTSTQSPHRLKAALALLFGRARWISRYRTGCRRWLRLQGQPVARRSADVLGRQLGQPLAWCPLRSEAFIADFHGRDMRGTGRLALDDTGCITAVDFDIAYNMGFAVGPSGGVSPLLCLRMVQGVYDIPVAHSQLTAVLSNRRPTTSYRGAGRPEATYLIEALMDHAARELGVDTLDFRRAHLITPDQMPYRTALQDSYDSGDYPGSLALAEHGFDWQGFDARRAEAQSRGKLLGRGMASYVEVCGVFSERMKIAIEATGNVRISTGTSSHGQGMKRYLPRWSLNGWECRRRM